MKLPSYPRKAVSWNGEGPITGNEVKFPMPDLKNYRLLEEYREEPDDGTEANTA